MKKLIALLLSIAIALSFVIVPADASSYSDILGIDESQYDMALYYEHLWENYNHDMHGLLWEAVCDPQYYVYPQVVGEVGSDGWIEFASSVTDEQLTKERYIEILSNLLVMMDYNTKDLIAEQVNADSTKKLKDYVVDVTGILVQTVSLDAAFGSHVTKNMEKIATAMDLTWGFADFTIDTIEIYESLNRTLRQYENHRGFLSAIAQNTTNATLKEATLELGEATDKAFFCKVNAVADTASSLAGYLGKDVFFDTIVLEYMVADASVLGISENDVAVLGVLKSAYEYMGTLQLAADLGVFAGDAIIGISDVMNRYNEMRALTDIRNALIQQMTSYRDSIQNVGDAEKIGKLCSLMKNLIYVNFRGEYCAHEMSTHDAQLYSLIIKINGQAETSDRVYEQAKENTGMYSLFVDMIFPELEFYRFEDISCMTAIDANDINAINALLIGVGYPPDHAEGAVTSWSDEWIFATICSKRLWDWDATYLAKLGIGNEFSIDLSLVEELTQDMFGRSFPVNVQSGLGSVAGNKLNVELIIGESTELVVQNGTKQGNRVTVVGSVYHHYVPFSEFCGYFSAELVENPSSIYGYTLTSIYHIEGNQNFDKLTASASSELKESRITHDANRAIDGNLDMAWVEGVRGVGINEWIRLETSDNSKMTVSAIEFSLGYQKSSQLLQNNGWPNKVLIECENGYKQEAEFYSCEYASVVILDRPQTTSWIKITILNATSGAKYDDTCISEICLYGIDPSKETTTDVSNQNEFAGGQTAEQLRKRIVGSWGSEGSVVSDYDFNSDGTCYWSFDKHTEGSYQIRDDKMLVISFPWMNDQYFWTEETYEAWRSHSSDDCWYMTDSGVLILNGVRYYRDGKVIKDYNTDGGLLATIAGAWVMDDFSEYRFFMDGSFEENTVFVSNGILLSRMDLDAGSIEIIDDTHAKLWNEAESFGEIPFYIELVYYPETDTLSIGGSNNVYHRAEYSD